MDTSEKGLEEIIEKSLVSEAKYESGDWKTDYNREYAIDEKRFFRFLESTQPETYSALLSEISTPYSKAKFLEELSRQITSRGILEVLLHNFSYKHLTFFTYQALPSDENKTAKELYEKNIFSVIRQVHFSTTTEESVDIVIFINGLPVSTMELKNSLTKQSTDDAVEQYKSRDIKAPLFNFKRCLVHFAVDDNTVKMCTQLCGRSSWFLPFNKGNNRGAGNPVNPDGLKTDYLWKTIFSKREFSNILENFIVLETIKDPKTGKKSEKLIFPRYHQLYVVKKLVKDVLQNGAGKRYLIQHSAGSGKSNSIAWLAYHLSGLKNSAGETIFDSIIVVTDRRNLDRQTKNKFLNFAKIPTNVGNAECAKQLKALLKKGKQIITSTVQRFSFVLEAIDENKGKHFAIIIDEAHSSQSGTMTQNMNLILGGEDPEDEINRIIETRKMRKDASYFAFTATPKSKTLEMFGTRIETADEPKFEPFDLYSMKQAIEEGFILDVVKCYFPYESYYRIIKRAAEDDQKLFDKKKAFKRIHKFVESHPSTIEKKARIMLEHFHLNIAKKIGGKARAMIVTSSIENAITYFKTVNRLLHEMNSPYKAIVAFSGSKQIDGKEVSESDLNGFPSSEIEDRFTEDPYRFLIVADKFQTGYDEPLLHTMYVDKPLSDVKAVQTLSRLNRARLQKNDTCVLDFANGIDTIEKAFSKFYTSTNLRGETDPNKLNELIYKLSDVDVYTSEDVEEFTKIYLSNEPRSALDPILDACAEKYKLLSPDEQIEFKGNAKSFVRVHKFLSAILANCNEYWLKLEWFLGLLIDKLPSPEDPNNVRGLMGTIDLESYRSVAKGEIQIALDADDAEIKPTIEIGGGHIPEAELLPVEALVEEFNKRFGDLDWEDKEKIAEIIVKQLPNAVKANQEYVNTVYNGGEVNAQRECESAVDSEIGRGSTAYPDLYNKYLGNPEFKEWLNRKIFEATYEVIKNENQKA